MKKREVVVTGIGAITASGIGWEPYWEDVRNAASRICKIPELEGSGFKPDVAGMIKDFSVKDFIPNRKQLKLMSKEIQLGIAVSQLAVRDADIQISQIDPFRIGITLGVGVLNLEADEMAAGVKLSFDEEGVLQMKKFGREGMSALFPLWFLKYLPNMPACHIAITHGLQGPCNTVTTSAAAGAQAIGEAFHVIQRGDADVMLAGASDSKINPMGLSRFHILGLLSRRNGLLKPEEIYCPFDQASDGLILGEGAAILVLEEKEHAVKRGAKVYAQIAGYGCSSDFNFDPASGEDCNGKSQAMIRALAESEIDLQDIGLIVANGSGIPQEDLREAQEIRSIFERHADKLKVMAVKPISGHLVYASAAVEIIAGMMAVEQGEAPPIANLNQAHSACDIPLVKGSPQKIKTKNFLINTFGFGGQNASLVVKR